MNVLLLVNERRTRSTLEVVLAQRGYRVSIHGVPADAEDALRRAQYGLAFVELTQDSVHDPELLSTLELAQRRDCVVVGLTPGSERSFVNDAGTLGDLIHHLLPKPLDAPTLRRCLDEVEHQLARSTRAGYDLAGRVATPDEIDALLRSEADLDLILDSQRRVRYVRPGIEQTTGFRPSDLIGRDVVELVEDEDRDSLAEAVASAGALDVRLREPDDGWSAWHVVIQERGDNGEQRGHRLIGERIAEPPAVEPPERRSDDSISLEDHLEQLNLLMLALDSDLTVRRMPSYTAAYLGRPAEEAVGRYAGDLGIISVDDAHDAIAGGAAGFQTRSTVSVPGGDDVSIRWHGSIRRIEGQIDSIVLVGIDELGHNAGGATDLDEDRIRALVEYSADLIFVFDADGHAFFVSPSVERLFHGQRDLSFGGEKLGRLHPDDREAARELFSSVLAASGAVVQEEIRLRVGSTESWRTFQVTARNLLGDATVGGVVVNAHDITGEREARADLRQSEQRFRALVQNSTDVLAILDNDAMIHFVSPSVERILGYSPEELTGQSLLDLIHEDDRARGEAVLANLGTAAGTSSQSELRFRHQDGSWRVVEAHCTNLFDEPGIAGIVMNARDITERKQLERRLTRRAFLDPLTGLPNRSLFLHRLERAMLAVPQNEQPVAVLFLDIDRFKVVNDSLGHEIGDQLLIAIGRRLQGLVRPADTVARFGGDEMIVLLAGITDASEAAIIAQRIIEQLGMPIQLEQHEVSVATSVGIAVSTDGEESPNDLIRNADIALYRAKESGSGRYVVFDESMASRMHERLTMESELRKAIEHGQFRLEYLPEIDLSSGNLLGLEVLVRWQHPERGEIPPDEFMLVANETGLIVPLGRQILNQACAQLRRWHLDHPAAAGNIFLAVNCSAREFQQPDVVDAFMRTLAQHSLQAEHLRLEVDEAVIAADPAATFDKFHRLRTQGVRLAIDDFGTGYSSLSYLTRATFDTLKIARRFISGQGGITSNLSIVRAVTSLAHALGMSVTAEGIETREHLTRVRAAGCDSGQGYLFSQPLEAHAVEALLFSGDSSTSGASNG